MKQVIMLLALSLSTVFFNILDSRQRKTHEFKYLWLIAMLVFIVFSKSGNIVFGDAMLSFSSWKSSGVLLLCGMTPVVIIGIIYFEFTGGYKLKSHFIYNAIAALALAQFIARIGCFFQGCCYGNVCSKDNLWAFWNVKVQAYTLGVVSMELAFLVLFFILYVFLNKKNALFPTLFFLLGNAILRFITDPLRLDPQLPGFFGEWGHAMELSVVLAGSAIYILIMYLRSVNTDV
ncbi:MAG: prolipoprotein diacylglyceryl transferase [Schleiferiaceae bacterium]|nr:prolipoprotein diacylglyceryl transferase [Schleiferiaceae bacterium]